MEQEKSAKLAKHLADERAKKLAAAQKKSDALAKQMLEAAKAAQAKKLADEKALADERAKKLAAAQKNSAALAKQILEAAKAKRLAEQKATQETVANFKSLFPWFF